MARLPRATLALMLSLLPAITLLTGAVVLGQIPTGVKVNVILLIVGEVAIHQPDAA